ncbi:MAG: response regulator transcription factor [Christensenellales bacterium]|jgi:two-component system response regulator YesN
MSYRVLIVDDDNIVLNGLKNLIDWEEMGFTIVGEANDGLMALNLIDELKPDLIVTDIYMRYCDGIRLMEQVRSSHPDIMFIVLSCYDNFDYAQKALRLGAFDYLLKSDIVQKGDLSETLKQVRDSLDKRHRDNEEMVELKKRLNLSMPRYRKQFMLDMLRGRIKDAENIAAHLLEMDFNPNSNNFCLMLLYLSSSKDHAGASEEIVEMDEEVVSLVLSIAKQYGVSDSFCLKHRTYFCLMEMEARGNLYSLDDRAASVAERMRIRINSHTGLDCLIILGDACSPAELPDTYKGIIAAFDHRIFLPPSAVLSAGKILDSDKDLPVESHYPELESSFFYAEEFEAVINRLFNEAGENRNLAYYKGIGDDLAKLYHKNAKEFVDKDDEADFVYLRSDYFLNFPDTDSARREALNLFSKLRDELLQQRNSSSKQLVSTICNYITENYASDISLDELANMTNFNKYYICKVFKKEMNMTITNYTLEKRMAKAKELLLRSPADVRIYEIAQKVGFGDVSYFVRMFKKITGETPREFANKNSRVSRSE